MGMRKLLFDLSGQLLVSTPNMRDKNKRNTVVFITTSTTDLITGVVLNHPMNQTVEQQLSNYTSARVLDAPLYKGGNQEEHTLSLSAWIWTDGLFELLFHIKEQEIDGLERKYPGAKIQVRGYIGHIQWHPLELFAEMIDKMWYPVPLNALFGLNSRNLWPGVILKTNPKLLLMTEYPEIKEES